MKHVLTVSDDNAPFSECQRRAKLDMASAAPYRWKHPKERGGTGGLIPQKYHPVLLDYAREHGVALKAEDFLPPSADASTAGEAAA